MFQSSPGSRTIQDVDRDLPGFLIAAQGVPSNAYQQTERRPVSMSEFAAPAALSLATLAFASYR
jgi:hypothetical protein